MSIWHTLTVAGLSLILVAAGCGDSGGGDATAASSGGAKRLTIGFSQVGAESGWRTANTESIKSEAVKRGHTLQFSDAQQKQENQIKAIRSFVTQRVDVIAFSPVVKTGWDDVLREAKEANIPVFLSDRGIETSDPSLYTSFVGADFVEEGRRAGRWAVEATNGKAVIAELKGTDGSDPALDRKRGFEEVIKGQTGMRIVFSQTGEFTRAKGREVMESFLKSPEGAQINLLFAHNDDMALGAIQAIEAAGKKPGVDILIVSIDGVRGAFEAMAEGKLNCTVECNPLLAPDLFNAIEKSIAGHDVPKRIVVDAKVYERKQAKDELPNRKY